MVRALCRFDTGINLVQTVAPDWRQIESLMALDLIIIPAVSALGNTSTSTTTSHWMSGTTSWLCGEGATGNGA